MKNLPPLPGAIAVKTVPNVPELLQAAAGVEIPSYNGDPMKFMEAIMDNVTVDLRIRFEAAKVLMPFKYSKLGEEGKKTKQQGRAAEATTGRFGTRGSNTPRLSH